MGDAEKDLASIEDAYVAMTSAMTDSHNAHPDESRSDYMRVVSMNAETLIMDAKQLARLIDAGNFGSGAKVWLPLGF